MLDQPSPLHRFPLITTGDVDQFHNALITRFGASAFNLGAAERGFQAVRSFVELPNVDLVFGSCTAPYSVRFPSVDMVKQHLALRNSGRTRFGGSQFQLSRTESTVIPAGIEMEHEYEADFEQFILRIQTSALQAKLSAIVGMPISRGIEFVRPSRSAIPGAERLRRMLGFMVSELDRDEDKVPPAALAEFEQLLLVTFLTANRHNFSDLLEREPPQPAPWQVRLVEDYITANWNHPITVEVLAAAAGASTRSIFKAFRDARRCSPMAFVKSIRLGHARRMLECSEPGTSVVSVAYACGFLNPGHFARDYRLAFGELPSITLAQSRHRRH
jgi:AraC-like DNA-binding protein